MGGHILVDRFVVPAAARGRRRDVELAFVKKDSFRAVIAVVTGSKDSCAC